MSQNNLSSTLAKEAAKLAKLSSLQSCLPGSMRAIPVAAIVAGGVIARVAGTSNVLEKRMIGADEMIALDNRWRETQMRHGILGKIRPGKMAQGKE